MTNVSVQTYNRKQPISKSPWPQVVIMAKLAELSGHFGQFGQNVK